MTITVTGSYDSAFQIRNTREDLIATGIPQEQIYVDEESRQLKVMIADATEPEVEEILRRHEAHEMYVTKS